MSIVIKIRKGEPLKLVPTESVSVLPTNTGAGKAMMDKLMAEFDGDPDYVPPAPIKKLIKDYDNLVEADLQKRLASGVVNPTEDPLTGFVEVIASVVKNPLDK